MKILVIEDSSSTLNLLCHQIRRMGSTPVPANNGQAGVDAFLADRPDLVLLDVVMPDISGFEVARRIRQHETPGEWTPIIFLTNLSKDEDLEQGIAAGGDDYLNKPISEVVLAAKIRAMQRIIQMRQSLLVVTRKLDVANQELKRLTSLDGLTGIANRRHFDMVLEREWRRAKRQGTEISVLMCDIDYFKGFNDHFGHQAGDDCLRLVANALSTATDRGGDLIARYGGEEFAAVLADTSTTGALFVAERMRQAVNELNIAHPLSPYEKITASIGCASCIPEEGMTAGALLGKADAALFQAKRDGRNRVCRLPGHAPTPAKSEIP